MRKFSAAVIAALSLSAMIGMNCEGAEFSTVCDYSKNAIKIKLDSQEEYNKKMIFYLMDGDVDADSINESNISNLIYNISEAEGNNGVYELIMPFPSERGKNYRIVYENYTAVEDEGGIPFSQRQALKYIASEDDIKTAMNAMNTATAVSVLDELNKYKLWFELPVTSEFDINNKIDSVMGELMIANKPSLGFSDFNNICELFKKAYAASNIKNAQSDNMKNALEEYGSELDIDVNDDYETYMDKINKKFEEECASLKNDNQLYEKIKNKYDEILALTVINNSSRDVIDAVLNRYNDIFKLDLSGAYSKLSSDDKINFNKALERKDFTSISAVKSTFNLRLQNITKTTPSPSTGGSGGGKSTTSYNPQSTATPEPTLKPDNQYNDLQNVEWAKEAIYALSEKGVISGYDDNSFRPDNNITRNEFIKMIVIAFNKIDETAEYDFTDGDKNAWYAKYVASAKKNGIINGYDDGRFGDNENITREDMAVMIYRLSEINAGENENLFVDNNEISDYAKEAVYALNKNGIISGMDDGRFAPKEFATRAQAAKVLYSVLGGVNGD